MTLMSTCEAVLIAKNEEIDALKQATELKDQALAEKNQLIHELATLLVDREQKLAVAIKGIEDVTRDKEKAVASEMATSDDPICVTPSPPTTRKALM